MIESYYNHLAPYYRYIFQDWEKSVVWHAEVIDGVIREYFGPHPRRLLDAACGIGTQCIGLAQLDYKVSASDISEVELSLAREEATRRSLFIEFIKADMRELREAHQGMFDLVIACDNAIPHLLSEEDILLAFQQFYKCTSEKGGCIISVRDYASMDLEGTRIYPRTIHQEPGRRLVLFDVWEFDGSYYDFATYIVEDRGETKAYTHIIRGGRYYCVSIEVLKKLLVQAGFSRVADVREKYHQPILIGLKI